MRCKLEVIYYSKQSYRMVLFFILLSFSFVGNPSSFVLRMQIAFISYNRK